MKKRLWFIISFFCITFFIKAQDTIFTTTQQTLLVRVMEISQTEVSYKNFYNPDGIIRKIGNYQVAKIIYENGKIESRFQLRAKTSDTLIKEHLFVVEDNHIALRNKDITHAAALKLMMKKDPQTNSYELNDALITAEGRKNGQIAFNILAPVSAVGGAYFALRHRYNTPEEMALKRTFFIGGLATCATSIIVAQIYKSLKNKQIRKAALMFNKEYYE